MSTHAARTATVPAGVRGRFASMSPGRRLRLVLRLDAAVSGLNGVAYLALAAPLESALGIEATVLRVAGAALVLFALGLVAVAARPRPSRTAVTAIVDANALWAVGSIVVLVAGWLSPTTLGGIWIALQAVVVADLAAMQYAAARRA